MKFISPSFLILFACLVAQAQTTPTVSFTMSPSVFQQGQSATTLICLSPLPAAGALTFNQNDVIGFQFDASIGTVTSVDSIVLLHSPTLVPADFDAHLNQVNHNKLSITYINPTVKTFAYMDTLCARVMLTAGPMVGSALLRYSSKFTGIAGIVGNLPYLSVSVVDFSIGPPGPQGVQGIPGPKGDTGGPGPAGTSQDLSSVLTRLSALEAAVEAPDRVYVVNSLNNTVSSIDPVRNVVAAILPIASPSVVAINPAKTRLYVAHGHRQVSVIDTSTSALLTDIEVGIDPMNMSVNAAGTRVYVINSTSLSVSVIDTSTYTVVASVPIGAFPAGMTINTSGTRVYVANGQDPGFVSVIDTATNTVTATIPVPQLPHGVALNPAGTLLYVAAAGGQIAEIDTATNTVVTVVQNSRSGTFDMAINGTGALVYVTNTSFNSVHVLDTATNSFIANVPVGPSPFSAALNAAGTRLYVANRGNNTVSIIDTSTNTVIATTPVGAIPISLAAR